MSEMRFEMKQPVWFKDDNDGVVETKVIARKQHEGMPDLFMVESYPNEWYTDDHYIFASEAEAHAEYRVGQEVYPLWPNSQLDNCGFTIDRVSIAGGEVSYHFGGLERLEKDCYPTRNAAENAKGEEKRHLPSYGIRYTCPDCGNTFACDRLTFGDILNETDEYKRLHHCEEK